MYWRGRGLTPMAFRCSADDVLGGQRVDEIVAQGQAVRGRALLREDRHLVARPGATRNCEWPIVYVFK